MILISLSIFSLFLYIINTYSVTMPTILGYSKISGNNGSLKTTVSPIVALKIGIEKGDHVVFMEENNRVYIQKA